MENSTAYEMGTYESMMANGLAEKNIIGTEKQIAYAKDCLLGLAKLSDALIKSYEEDVSKRNRRSEEWITRETDPKERLKGEKGISKRNRKVELVKEYLTRAIKKALKLEKARDIIDGYKECSKFAYRIQPPDSWLTDMWASLEGMVYVRCLTIFGLSIADCTEYSDRRYEIDFGDRRDEIEQG